MNSKSESIDLIPSLITRCKSGDNKAYNELYHLYTKAMFNISMRIVNNKDEAEDILQESFLKAFKNMQQFNKEAAFAGWLKRVVINHSIDVVRKQKENFISIDKAGYIENEETEEEEDMDYDVETVKRCVQELPDGYRIVLTLYLFEDYSHKDIATMLHITEGTSKSQYNRAKKRLIKLMKEKMTPHEK